MISVSVETKASYSDNHHLPGIKEFISRLKIGREYTTRIKENGEKWPFSQGLYCDSDHALVNLLHLPADLYQKMDFSTEPPTFHSHLGIFIKKLIQTKPSNEPVVALDIGGGAGLTWAMTAANFGEEVKAGKVIFAVSNLVWSKEQFANPYQKTFDSGLVHYISSTFRGLLRKSITLPNGDILPLKGVADLIHESQSLTRWSQVPELDILSLSRLISPYGTYFISHPTTPCLYDQVTNARQNQIQRENVIRQVHRLLQSKYGFRSILQVEDGEFAGSGLLYSIFRKSKAPRIEI